MRYWMLLALSAVLLTGNTEFTRAQDTPDLSRYSDLELWFARAPRIAIADVDLSKLDAAQRKMISTLTDGTHVIDAEVDETFRQCRESTSGWLGAKVYGSVLPLTFGATVKAILGSGGTAAKAVKDAHREYRNCLESFYKRASDASQVLKAANGRAPQSVISVSDVGIYATELSDLIGAFSSDGTTAEVHFEKSLSDLKGDQLKALGALVDEIAAQKAKQAEAARLAEIQGTISASGDGVRLFASILLAKDAKALNTTIESSRAVETIANSVVQLSAADISKAGAAIASMNIVGAVFALSSLFSASDDESNSVLLRQLTDIRDDLNVLRSEMNDRFDRIDAALDLLNRSIEGKFKIANKKLDDIISELKEAERRGEINHQVVESYLSYIAQHEFRKYSNDCFHGVTSINMSLKEFGPCFSAFLQYATDYAATDAETGRAYYHPSNLPEQSFTDLIWAPPGRQVGYLTALIEQQSLPGSGATKSINPEIWAAGADMYLTALQRAWTPPHNSQISEPREKIIFYESDNLKSILNAGEVARRQLAFVRTEGRHKALEMYGKALGDLISVAIDQIVQRLTETSLDNYELVEVRRGELRNEEDTGGYDGSHWYRMRLFLEYVWVGRVPPFEGKRLFTEHSSYLVWHKLHMPKGGGTNELAFAQELAKEQPASDFVNNASPSKEEIAAKIAQVNSEYLRVTPYSRLTDQAKNSLDLILRGLPPDPRYAELEASLKASKALAIRSLLIGRSEVSSELYEEIERINSLPDTVSALVELARSGSADPSLVTENYLKAQFGTISGSVQAERFSESAESAARSELLDVRISAVQALLAESDVGAKAK